MDNIRDKESENKLVKYKRGRKGYKPGRDEGINKEDGKKNGRKGKDNGRKGKSGLSGNSPANISETDPPISETDPPIPETDPGLDEREDGGALCEETSEEAVQRLLGSRDKTGGVPLKDCIEAFVEGEGYISRAARIMGVTTATFNKYIKRYKSLKELVVDYQTARLDEAEKQLLKQVDKGDVSAIRFFLSSQGKERGYVPESKGILPLKGKAAFGTTPEGNLGVATYLEFARTVMTTDPELVDVTPEGSDK